jgi:midasin (ATPase involved in ribosome maturation)
MGVDKMKQLNARNETSPNSIEKWTEFQKSSERFEKQRVACDTGLAFVFTEGALVDAIRTGKW